MKYGVSKKPHSCPIWQANRSSSTKRKPSRAAKGWVLTSAKVVGGAFALIFIASIGQAEAGQCGKASYYGEESGSKTASGERLSSGALTAAHRSLPFGTQVRVENLGNGRSVVVRINDRGPFVSGRVIDVTKTAAAQLGMISSGIASVKLTVVGSAAALSGSC